MADGTYADESPDASIGERLANSIRKIVGNTAAGTPPVGTGGRAREQAITKATDDAALGRMKQAQSTDRDNSYSY